MLAGKLNWACRVVYGGCTFLRCITDQMNLLKSSNAKFKLNQDVYDDLTWWLSFLNVFNGKCMFLEKCPSTDVQTDASSLAAGAFFRGDWIYHAFVSHLPFIRDLYMNYKEVLAIVYAAQHWCLKDWSNKHIIISLDSTTAVSIISKGTCKNPIVMKFLRELFWLSAFFNFRITAKFIPGHKNLIADAISHLHKAKFLFHACNYILEGHNHLYLQNCLLLLHMPYTSYLFLLHRYTGSFSC